MPPMLWTQCQTTHSSVKPKAIWEQRSLPPRRRAGTLCNTDGLVLCTLWFIGLAYLTSEVAVDQKTSHK